MFVINKYLKEIRSRIVYFIFSFTFTFLIFYIWNEDLFYFLNWVMPPSTNTNISCSVPIVLPESNEIEDLSSTYTRKFIFTDVTEAFYTSIWLAAGFTVYLLCPLFIYHYFAFLLPSLFYRERINFIKYFFLILFFYGLASSIVISILFPIFWNFFMNFEKIQDFIQIYCEVRVSSYVYFILKISFFTHIFFQLPCLFILLIRYKIVEFTTVVEGRRILYFIILLITAFFTPPDIFIQFFLSLLFIFFLEVFFFLHFISIRYTS